MKKGKESEGGEMAIDKGLTGSVDPMELASKKPDPLDFIGADDPEFKDEFEKKQAELAALLDRFNYKAISRNVADRIDGLRGTFKEVAVTVVNNCPEGKVRDLAVRKIEEGLMWAVKSLSHG